MSSLAGVPIPDFQLPYTAYGYAPAWHTHSLLSNIFHNWFMVKLKCGASSIADKGSKHSIHHFRVSTNIRFRPCMLKENNEIFIKY